MSHLTEEQFEDILTGRLAPPDHLHECDVCNRRLIEKRAVAARLLNAFNSVKPGDDLVQRIRETLNTATIQPPKKEFHMRMRFIWRNHQLFSRLTVAATLLVILVPAGIYMTTTSQAHAAHLELLKIHQHNLAELPTFIQSSDPAIWQEYFTENLGYSPACVCTGQELTLHGCCVHEYRGQNVGSYVIDTPEGKVSIIILSDTPKALRMKLQPNLSSPDIHIWIATCDCCNMTARRIGERTYYALGDVAHNTLARILIQLI